LRRGQELTAAADAILARLGALLAELEGANGQMAAEMEALQRRWQERLAPLERQKEELEGELFRWAKAHREEVFTGESCRVELRHGALLYEVQRRVVRARGVLARLQEMGLAEAIRVTEAVDWDRLESWPDERLEQVGTRRQRKENYSYEVRR